MAEKKINREELREYISGMSGEDLTWALFKRTSDPRMYSLYSAIKNAPENVMDDTDERD